MGGRGGSSGLAHIGINLTKPNEKSYNEYKIISPSELRANITATRWKHDFKSLQKKLTYEKQEQIRLYTDNAGLETDNYWSDINYKLRTRTTLTHEQKEYVTSLNNTLKRFKIPEDVVLYRGIKLYSSKDVNKILKLFNITRQRSFLSASLDKNIAIDFAKDKVGQSALAKIVLEIMVDQGHEGLLIEEVSNARDEKEVLFPKNQHFQTVEVTKVEDKNIDIDYLIKVRLLRKDDEK